MSDDASAHSDDILARLVREHGRTFADEAGIAVRDTPAPLFQLLVLAHLLAANLDAEFGVRAAATLRRTFRTPERLLEGGEDAVYHALTDARYLRKRQSAGQVVAMSHEVVDRWHGDLRLLRERCHDIPAALEDFTGVGPVGRDVFLREVQAVWPSVRPYADERVLTLAREHGIPHTPVGLAHRSGTDDLSVIGAALIRADRANRSGAGTGRRSRTER